MERFMGARSLRELPYNYMPCMRTLLRYPIFGSPRRMFADSYFRASTTLPRTYDLSPDGETFVMIRDSEERPQTERFRVIQNFFTVVRQEAPAQR